MALPSTFTCSHVFTFALSVLAVTACGDDEGAAVTPATDAGDETHSAATDAAASSLAATSDTATNDTATSDTAAHADSGTVSTCATIAAACEGEQDEGSAEALCLNVVASGNEAQCSVVSDTCLAFCETGELPPETGSPNEAQCSEMGKLCHEYDEGSGLGHLCHEVGHGGNLEWCSVIYSACAELCHIEASDAGIGHEHTEADATHDVTTSHHEPLDGGRSDELDAASVTPDAAIGVDAATDAGD